jgi:hypothetical protein
VSHFMSRVVVCVQPLSCVEKRERECVRAEDNREMLLIEKKEKGMGFTTSHCLGPLGG